MKHAAVAAEHADPACLCRFSLGRVRLEVLASPAKPPEGGLASFEHAGLHFVVREVGPAADAADPLHEILTSREREIARLVAGGLRNKQIAWELHLSEYTVAAYIKHICYKLQVRNRTAMVTRCNQLGSPGELASPACRRPEAP